MYEALLKMHGQLHIAYIVGPYTMAVASRRWAWCDISPVLPISPQENNEKW
jgi:hypothetical protein